VTSDKKKQAYIYPFMPSKARETVPLRIYFSVFVSFDRRGFCPAYGEHEISAPVCHRIPEQETYASVKNNRHKKSGL
jgi:hypothetical protein